MYTRDRLFIVSNQVLEIVKQYGNHSSACIQQVGD